MRTLTSWDIIWRSAFLTSIVAAGQTGKSKVDLDSHGRAASSIQRLDRMDENLQREVMGRLCLNNFSHVSPLLCFFCFFCFFASFFSVSLLVCFSAFLLLRFFVPLLFTASLICFFASPLFFFFVLFLLVKPKYRRNTTLINPHKP